LAFEIEAAAEASALADRLGVPYAVHADAVIGGPLASAAALTKLAKMNRGDYSADFSLEWAVKDLDLALAASGAETTPVVSPSRAALISRCPWPSATRRRQRSAIAMTTGVVSAPE